MSVLLAEHFPNVSTVFSSSSFGLLVLMCLLFITREWSSIMEHYPSSSSCSNALLKTEHKQCFFLTNIIFIKETSVLTHNLFQNNLVQIAYFTFSKYLKIILPLFTQPLDQRMNSQNCSWWSMSIEDYFTFVQNKHHLTFAYWWYAVSYWIHIFVFIILFFNRVS